MKIEYTAPEFEYIDLNETLLAVEGSTNDDGHYWVDSGLPPEGDDFVDDLD